jgi:hypothetical protein
VRGQMRARWAVEVPAAAGGGTRMCDLAIERDWVEMSGAPGTANTSQCLGVELCIRELDSVGKVSKLNIQPECIDEMPRPTKHFVFRIFDTNV